MANEYLISKWKLWFRIHDIGNKGTICRSDVRQSGETFDGQRELQDSVDKLCNEYIFRGKSGPINEQEFIDMNILDYTSNKQKFVEGIRKGYTALFDLFDVRGDGFISEEEFVKLMRADGHDNDDKNKEFFSVFNTEDGKVASRVLVDASVQFMTCDD